MFVKGATTLESLYNDNWCHQPIAYIRLSFSPNLSTAIVPQLMDALRGCKSCSSGEFIKLVEFSLQCNGFVISFVLSSEM